jgi:hypothetical protein
VPDPFELFNVLADAGHRHPIEKLPEPIHCASFRGVDKSAASSVLPPWLRITSEPGGFSRRGGLDPWKKVAKNPAGGHLSVDALGGGDDGTSYGSSQGNCSGRGGLMEK